MCEIRFVVVTKGRKSPFVIYSSVAYSKNMYPIRFIFCHYFEKYFFIFHAMLLPVVL